MKKLFGLSKLWILWSIIACLAGAPVRAEVVFENFRGDGETFFPSTLEHGDDLWLGGSDRILTDFSFEYFGDFTPTGNERARIRFYENLGPGKYPTPSKLLFDTGAFQINAGFSVGALSGLALQVPDVLTFTVEFSGFDPARVGLSGHRAGLIIHNPPRVGASFRDFWLRQRTGWGLFHFPNFDPSANFGILAEALAHDKVVLTRQGIALVAEWYGNYQLQMSPSLDQPFNDVIGANSPHQVLVGANRARFFRLVDRFDPEHPELSIRRLGKTLIFEWSGDANLQVANSPNGPFRLVRSATSPYNYVVQPSETRYWRLYKEPKLGSPSAP